MPEGWLEGVTAGLFVIAVAFACLWWWQKTEDAGDAAVRREALAAEGRQRMELHPAERGELMTPMERKRTPGRSAEEIKGEVPRLRMVRRVVPQQRKVEGGRR